LGRWNGAGVAILPVAGWIAGLVAVVGLESVVEYFLIVAADSGDVWIAVHRPRREVTNVGAGELERVDEKSGAFVVDAAVENGLHDFLNADLNGVGIFEHRKIESGVAFHGDWSADVIVAAAARTRFVMPVAIIGVTHGNCIANLTIGKNMGAMSQFIWHKKDRARGAVYPSYISR